MTRTGDGTSAVVRDVIRLGFEVRVIVAPSDGDTIWLQLTHDEAQQLNLEVGERVMIRRRN